MREGASLLNVGVVDMRVDMGKHLWDRPETPRTSVTSPRRHVWEDTNEGARVGVSFSPKPTTLTTNP